MTREHRPDPKSKPKQRPATLLTLFVALVAIVLGVVAWQRMTAAPATAAGGVTGKAWFTVDDGKTWFADDARKLPPFDYQGKPAVLCFVYKTGNHQPWVSHLMRYTPEGKTAIETRRAKGGAGFAMPSPNIAEVKRPGAATWVSTGDPRSAEIQEPRAPDGTTDAAEQVDPN